MPYTLKLFRYWAGTYTFPVMPWPAVPTLGITCQKRGARWESTGRPCPALPSLSFR